jgi:electron transfer flavoprotein-quinone oxidoreductase
VSDADTVDVIVVGAGVAGLACARVLAEAGREVLVLERGDPAGAKNLSGGRFYLGPLDPVAPGLFDGAPFERRVTREALTLLHGAAATRLEHHNPSLGDEERRSFTVLRARLDAWQAERVAEAGGTVVTEALAERLVVRDGRVGGVVVAGEELAARVVVLADGALSFLGRAAGLRHDLAPVHFVVGIKALWGLDRGTLEDRFGLEPNDGAAELLLGDLTEGLPGGGFIYTNADTISLGVVVSADALGRSSVDASTLVAALEARPAIARWLAGAELLEYGAHLIPEAPADTFGRSVGDGVLLVGDAAGLVLNHGLTVRGMDLAAASGAIAGRAIHAALEAGDTSRASLSRYEDELASSFVGRDLAEFRGAAGVVGRPWLAETLPPLAAQMLEELFSFGRGRKERLSTTAWRHLRRKVLNLGSAGELWRLRKL